MCQFPVTMSRLEEVYHNMNWMTSTHVFASSQLASSYYTAPNISWPYCSLKFLVLWQINDIQLLKTTFKPLHVGRCALKLLGKIAIYITYQRPNNKTRNHIYRVIHLLI